MRAGATYGRCFACGYRVGWIDAVAQRSGLAGREAFWWALDELARRAGLAAPSAAWREAGPERALELAARWLRERLQDREDGAARCRAYLASRGIRPERAGELPVGYLPSPDRLVAALRAAGCSNSQIAATGLGASYLALAPLIFIYEAPEGRPAGFKGRAPDPTVKRILNARGFGAAREQQALYGVGLAREAVRRARLAVLVEGEFDVLHLHMAGRVPVLGVGGTAKPAPATMAALRALGAERVILAFDADPPGQAATLAALGLAWAQRLEPLVAALPDGAKDPDEACRALGPEAAWRQIAQAPLGPADWLLRRWARWCEALTPDSRARVMAEARALAASAPPTVLDALAGALAPRLGVARDSLADELWTAADRARRAAALAAARRLAADLGRASEDTVDDLLAQARAVLGHLEGTP
jgi:DNA primase